MAISNTGLDAMELLDKMDGIESTIANPLLPPNKLTSPIVVLDEINAPQGDVQPPREIDSSSLDALAVLDEIKAPQGVTQPPREIKSILEKTAGYVARNGIAFEDRIREKETNNSKFSFLSPNDAYNNYYLWRLHEIREGRGTAIAAGRAEETVEIVPEKPRGPPEPPEYQFSARMPNINAQDYHVVKLTALFVAHNGRQFMTALSQRETGNYQFDFLRPNHTLHGFFQRMIDQYTLLIGTNKIDSEAGKLQQERLQELEATMENKLHVLERARQRAEWLKFQGEQKVKEIEEAEREKITYAQIDWHDFMIIETVLFTEDDDYVDLPLPTQLSQLQFASLDQKASMSLSSHNMRIEEALPEDYDYYNYYHAYPQPPQPIINEIMPTRASQPQRESENKNTSEKQQAETKDKPAEVKKVKAQYVPRAAARAAAKPNTVLCPNCNTQILVDEYQNHLRIELLDPAWKEQKEREAGRFHTTNLTTADITNNLKRLASQRSDVFDSGTSDPLTDEEVARRKRAANSTYDVIAMERKDKRWDRVHHANVEKQIKAIHQKFSDTK